jgi:hypothetical protein
MEGWINQLKMQILQQNNLRRININYWELQELVILTHFNECAYALHPWPGRRIKASYPVASTVLMLHNKINLSKTSHVSKPLRACAWLWLHAVLSGASGA